MVTPAPRHGPMRAAHADREQVVDALKAAFVQGRLTQDELDARVGQALAARTYAELAALTTDLPAGPDRAPAPAPGPSPAHARPRNRSANRAVKVGAGAIGTIILVICGIVLALGQPVAAAVLAMIFTLLTAAAAAVVAGLIAVTVKAESRRQNRSRGQLPPGADGKTDGKTDGVRAAGPARPHQRRPHGSLALGRAS